MAIRKNLSILFFSSLVITGCSDYNAEQCKNLLNDEVKQSLAFSYCEKAAMNGNADSQFHFATLLLTQGNMEIAVDFLEKSANQKNGQAAYQLGELYETGKLPDSEFEKAKFYYNESCKQDNLKGCERIQFFNKQEFEKERVRQLALEEAKANTLKQEQAKLQAEARLQEQKRLANEAKMKKAESDALEAKLKNRKFYYDLAKYKEGNLWGYINKKGDIVIPLQWAYAADFYDGLAAVKTSEGKWGFITTYGNYQIQPQFSCVFRFTEELAAVSFNAYGEKCQGGKWGFIDKNGQWVINPVLDNVIDVFKNGVAKVAYNGYIGYINKQGQWVHYQE